jgi:hypothetical protein
MTKNRIIVALALLALMCPSAFAKDVAFDAFWLKFKTALQKNDKEAIASMTKLPYGYDKPVKTKKEFMVQCDKIFPKKIRDCLLKQKPVQDKTTFSAFCGEDIYLFEKVNGNYLFTEIGVND